MLKSLAYLQLDQRNWQKMVETPKKRGGDPAIWEKSQIMSFFPLHLKVMLSSHKWKPPDYCCDEPEAENRMPLKITRDPPWERRQQHHIKPVLEGISNKAEDQAIIRAAAERAIEEWNSDLTIYTDGSAVAGWSKGGAGAVVHIHDDPPRYETLHAKVFWSTQECWFLILRYNKLV